MNVSNPFLCSYNPAEIHPSVIFWSSISQILAPVPLDSSPRCCSCCVNQQGWGFCWGSLGISLQKAQRGDGCAEQVAGPILVSSWEWRCSCYHWLFFLNTENRLIYLCVKWQLRSSVSELFFVIFFLGLEFIYGGYKFTSLEVKD